MTTKADVVGFVQKFKDDVLIPCAEAGGLDAEMTLEAVDIFLYELEQQEAAARVISITKDGNWRDLHPLSAMPFELDGKKFGSITHFRFAIRFIGSDDDCAEYICEGRTPEIALRRGEEAMSVGKVKREDWEYSEEENLKKGYRALLSTHEALRVKFLITTSAIEFTNTSDGVLGTGLDGKGRNLLPKILRELRKEMN